MDSTKKLPKKNRKKKMGLFPILLLFIFLISLTGCLYLLYEEINKEISIKDMENDVQTFIMPQTTSTTDQMNNMDAIDNTETATSKDNTYIFDWDGMLEQSPYVIGWIQFPGIQRINYPIVQHPDDNQFFLSHDWKGDPLSAGAIFANKNNASDFTDMNTIIYGHRMKAGSMFGLLKKYEVQTFIDENPYFHIYTPDGRKLTYEIVCCAHVKDGSDAYLQHFLSPDERMTHYNTMIENATTKRDVELNRFDTTVMLSTCNTTGYYDRVVILGKLTAIDLKGQPENWTME